MEQLTLTVISGPAAGCTCTKEGRRFCLGRVKTGNALALKDPMVSSKHVELELIDGTWFALDLQSSNGTQLNDSTSNFLEGQRYKLQAGDVLHLGPETAVQVQFQQDAMLSDDVTVDAKLTADAERLAASIKAVAESSVKQIRQEWATQRASMAALAQG